MILCKSKEASTCAEREKACLSGVGACNIILHLHWMHHFSVLYTALDCLLCSCVLQVQVG